MYNQVFRFLIYKVSQATPIGRTNKLSLTFVRFLIPRRTSVLCERFQSILCPDKTTTTIGTY